MKGIERPEKSLHGRSGAIILQAHLCDGAEISLAGETYPCRILMNVAQKMWFK